VVTGVVLVAVASEVVEVAEVVEVVVEAVVGEAAL